MTFEFEAVGLYGGPGKGERGPTCFRCSCSPDVDRPAIEFGEHAREVHGVEIGRRHIPLREAAAGDVVALACYGLWPAATL